jgi:hypothetical protein
VVSEGGYSLLASSVFLTQPEIKAHLATCLLVLVVPVESLYRILSSTELAGTWYPEAVRCMWWQLPILSISM